MGITGSIIVYVMRLVDNKTLVLPIGIQSNKEVFKKKLRMDKKCKIVKKFLIL